MDLSSVPILQMPVWFCGLFCQIMTNFLFTVLPSVLTRMCEYDSSSCVLIHLSLCVDVLANNLPAFQFLPNTNINYLIGSCCNRLFPCWLIYLKGPISVAQAQQIHLAHPHSILEHRCVQWNKH